MFLRSHVRKISAHKWLPDTHPNYSKGRDLGDAVAAHEDATLLMELLDKLYVAKHHKNFKEIDDAIALVKLGIEQRIIYVYGRAPNGAEQSQLNGERFKK